MKKKYLIYGICLIVVGVVGYFAYSWYKQNTTKSEEVTFSTNIDDKYSFVGVTDDKYYYVKDGKLSCHDKNVHIFSKDLEDSVINIFYDKYIFIIYKNGNIVKCDRNTGKEVARLKDMVNISGAKYRDSHLVLYFKDQIGYYDEKLREVVKLQGLQAPVESSLLDKRMAVLEFKNSAGKAESVFSIYENAKKLYSISTVNEVFYYTSIVDKENTILISNRYIYLFKGEVLSDKIMLENIRAIDFYKDNLVLVDGRNLRIFDKKLKELDNEALEFDATGLSIRDSAIVVMGKDRVSVYENNNIINEEIKNVISYYISRQGVYVILKNKIEKIKAY
ncbi:hypothetical protein ACQRBF_05710 [Peptoniphilaceae bacterium SGI.131]